MPFAWAARPLFRQSGELETTVDIATIYRQEAHRNSDEDLLKILNDYRRYLRKKTDFILPFFQMFLPIFKKYKTRKNESIDYHTRSDPDHG